MARRSPSLIIKEDRGTNAAFVPAWRDLRNAGRGLGAKKPAALPCRPSPRWCKDCGPINIDGLPAHLRTDVSMPAAKQRVLMLEAPRQARFADIALPSAGPDDVIVRSRYSTFKHGTEMMAYLGRSPLADITFNHELRLFETEKPQDFYPRPMGNMVVGAVEWAGGDVRHLRQGQLAFGWAPIADVHVMR